MKRDLERRDERHAASPLRRRGASACIFSLSVAALLLLAARPARAGDDEGSFDPSGVRRGPDIALGPSSIPMRLIGHHASGGHAGEGQRGGAFVGVDTGVSLALAGGPDPMQHAWAFGARAGYELHNGVALQLRYDYLGLAPHLTDPPTRPEQIASAGLRYTLPFVIPLPFVEALWGPSINGDAVSIAGGLGLGCSVPIGRHLRIDLSVRDWIAPIDEQVRQTLTFELGAAVTFASPGRS